MLLSFGGNAYPKCNRQLFSTDYTVEVWDELTDTEKIEIINQCQQVTVSETEDKTNDQSLVYSANQK